MPRIRLTLALAKIVRLFRAFSLPLRRLLGAQRFNLAFVPKFDTHYKRCVCLTVICFVNCLCR